MFTKNDIILYATHGVCEIVGIENLQIDGAKKEFFVLKPKNSKVATFYVPTWNEKALSKMRKLLTKKEIDSLIDSMPSTKPTWIENNAVRKSTYQKILTNGDHAAVISMIQALYFHKKECENMGKHLHLTDEQFMKDAEQLLYNEWQYVLHVDKPGLMTYIFTRIEKQNQQ